MSKAEVSDDSTIHPVRANSIGVDAPVTLSDPPGKSAVDTPNGGIAALCRQSGRRSATASGSRLRERAPRLRGSQRALRRMLLRRLRSVGGTHKRLRPNGRSARTMLSAATRDGAVALRQKEQGRRKQTRARRLPLPGEAVGILGSSAGFKTLPGWHEISSRLTVSSCC
jgi:hypothetical protein